MSSWPDLNGLIGFCLLVLPWTTSSCFSLCWTGWRTAQVNSSKNRSKRFPQYLCWLHQVGSFFVDQVVLLFSICVCVRGGGACVSGTC